METEPNSIVLEEYFSQFRNNIVGINNQCSTRYGNYPVVYADWIAEGRLYTPIEERISAQLGPFVANPHSYSSYTGQNITAAYKEARKIIRQHVNADENDILVTVGHGMTGALQRFIQILDLKYDFRENRPTVFITHMEHHSNHTTWEQTRAELIVIPPDREGQPDISWLREKLEELGDRKLMIGSFTAASNVTGIITPYSRLATEMHRAGGLCFVDYAASAPYVDMDMHPQEKEARLDAIFFAPHKFLGGPGSCGVLLFNRDLHSGIPSITGGGNVRWTQPGGGFGFSKDLETQEDGGTPAYLQTIRTALAIKLKEKMGTGNIRTREHDLMIRAIRSLKDAENIQLIGCENEAQEKIGALSFNIKGLHYNLVVRLLNDRYGIQTRGGWSCASTYGHYLFDLDPHTSDELVERLESGNFTGKPGWVRLSIHPTMTDRELEYCVNAIREIGEQGEEWSADYRYNPGDNEYYPIEEHRSDSIRADHFFEI